MLFSSPPLKCLRTVACTEKTELCRNLWYQQSNKMVSTAQHLTLKSSSTSGNEAGLPFSEFFLMKPYEAAYCRRGLRCVVQADWLLRAAFSWSRAVGIFILQLTLNTTGGFWILPHFTSRKCDREVGRLKSVRMTTLQLWRPSLQITALREDPPSPPTASKRG